MDDPIDLRVSTVGRVHPNNEVLLRIIPRMHRKKIFNKIDILLILKVNELKKAIVRFWFPSKRPKSTCNALDEISILVALFIM